MRIIEILFMKKLRILQVEFDTELKRYELPAFRAAVSTKAGHEHVLFHNHIGGTEYRHRYPLIQYKSIAGRAVITCLEDGIEEIHHFFNKPNWNIVIGEEEKRLTIQKLNINQFTMQVWDSRFTYSIQNWLALNAENYKGYQGTESLAQRIRMLEQLLTANILSFAKGIDWYIENAIQLSITRIDAEKIIKHKGVGLTAFNLIFTTNVFLPNYVGLGKGAGFGFGTVKEEKGRERNTKHNHHENIQSHENHNI